MFMPDEPYAQRIREAHEGARKAAAEAFSRAGAEGAAADELLDGFTHALNGALAAAFLAALPDAERSGFT